VSTPADRPRTGRPGSGDDGSLRGAGHRLGRRLGRLLGRRSAADAGLDPDRADLVVVASGFDDAEASSAALARAEATEPRFDPVAPVVLRHHLLLPAAEVAETVTVAAQDGYQRVEAEPLAEPEPAAAVTAVPDGQRLALQRVQVLDALHCSQERSRMAGLAQRRGGAAIGWEALQPSTC
jgi:hypothetical protein